MKKTINGWAVKDDDRFTWIDVPPKDWFHYNEKIYKATLTVDLSADITDIDETD